MWNQFREKDEASPFFEEDMPVAEEAHGSQEENINAPHQLWQIFRRTNPWHDSASTIPDFDHAVDRSLFTGYDVSGNHGKLALILI